MRPIALEDIESLAIGAWILGTGAAAARTWRWLNMRQLYARV